jgi:hypothetical protein
MRDQSIAKKSLAIEENVCRSRTIASDEDNIGLNIMKEAYQKYGSKSIDQTKVKRNRKGAERAIIASYETLMEFKETYLLGLFHQLGKYDII